jgi:hypothetical protein
MLKIEVEYVPEIWYFSSKLYFITNQRTVDLISIYVISVWFVTSVQSTIDNLFGNYLPPDEESGRVQAEECSHPGQLDAC